MSRTYLLINFLLLIFYANPVISFGQVEDIRIKMYNLKNGLSNTNVRSIVQDKEGYIWIATVDGLNKFNGYEFTNYQYDEKNLNSIPTNDVRSLFVDSQNNLWISTTKGLSQYNYETDDFINLLLEDSTTLGMYDIINILEDLDGTFWLSTNMEGVIIYNQQSKTTTRLKNIPGDPSSLSSNNVLSIFSDSKNNIWVTTIDQGINLYNRSTKSFKRFKHETSNPYSLAGDDVHSMTEDTEGNIWIACHYKGLSRIHISKIDEGKFQNYYHSPTNSNSIIDNSARIICSDRRGGIWIGTENGKVDFYKNDLFFHYNFKEFPTATLTENQTNSIYQDKDNDIWVGTYFGGAYMIHKVNPAFETYDFSKVSNNDIANNKVWEFAEDPEGIIWIATDDGGLKSFNPKTKEIKNYTTENTNLNTNKILCVYIDSKKRIWIGTWRRGISLFDSKTGNFKAYTAENTALLNNNIFDITEDFKGNLWLATQNGLSKFDPENETFKTYTTSNSKLVFNQMEVIKTDYSGNLLIGNVMGFIIFNPENEKFINYVNDPNDESSISNNYITSIFEENKSTLWITTHNGLNRLDRNSGKFKRYMVEDGLPSNYTLGVEKDERNHFWISTNLGISELNTDNNTILNYTIDDGLQDYLFIKKSHFKTSDGKIYFGGIKGFNIITPDKLEIRELRMPLVFTDFLISNKPVKPNDETGMLKSRINNVRQVTLTHKHPTFSVRYATISFLNPENSRYAYKLEGFDKNWNYVGNQRQATYTNLDPGKYILKVVDIAYSSLDEKNAITLSIKILPPWWNTILFKIATGLAIVVIVLSAYYTRIGRLKKQKKLLENEVQLRTNDLSEANKKLIEKQEELFEINIKLEENQDEILAQNDELEQHRNHLEVMVSERTKELEQAMKKVEESDKLKSAFLANMSHEIRTPMNAIVGFASLLDNLDLNHDDRKNFIETINNNCETLIVLINDIIDISMIESNQVKINPSPFHVNTIFLELLKTYNLKKSEKIDLIFDNLNDTEQIILVNDPVRFKQVISNLIANALKYTEIGKVNFGYQIIEQQFRCYVSDTGIGVSVEDQEKIFNQFHKIENPETKIYRGVGIGLSICKSLIELMGGTIWLESELNVGSTFYFTLPYNEKMETDKKESSATNGIINRPDLTGVKILIAENEPDNFLLLQKIISPSHAEIIWAKNGQEAVEITDSMTSSDNLIILMDIKMPIMDGIEATQLIHKKHNNVPIIAVTAYASENDKALILQNRFNGYITKPIRINELFKIINDNINVKPN